MGTVALVAGDVAPSGCFSRLAAVLESAGHTVKLMVSHGQPQKEDGIGNQLSEILDADVLLLGMSSSEALASSEIQAGRLAKLTGIPYGFYGDVPRCYMRARPGSWFHEFAANTAFYFGVNQKDADAAAEVFPHATLVGAGNPLREESATPRFSREEVRLRLGIASDEIMVLAPGGKVGPLNIATWTLLAEALFLVQRNEKKSIRLVLAPHPGDRTPFALDSVSGKQLGLYEELTHLSPIRSEIVGRERLTSSEMIPGADLVVEFGTSIGVEAAYQNIPVITLGLEMAFRRLEEVQGSRVLEVLENGISECVSPSAGALHEAITRLLTEDGFKLMRARQIKHYPKPRVGSSLVAMADALSIYTFKM